MSEANEQQGIEIPLRFTWPDDLVSRYATNFVSQYTTHEFALSFFEVLSPVLLGSATENAQKLADIGAVQARCVSRIVMSPHAMKELIDVLQRNYDRYISSQKGAE